MRAIFFALAPIAARCFVLPPLAPTMNVHTPAHGGRMHPRAIRLFFESQKQEGATAATEFEIQTRKTHARELTTDRTGCSVVVTEGTDAFYASRSLIQMLHDFGNHKSLVVVTENPNARKALLTRQARYSGLLDTLDFSAEFVSADAWLAINADEATLAAQLEAAVAAGIKRVFLLLTPDGPTACPTDCAATEAMFEKAGVQFTMMRTGSLVDDSAGGGSLRISDVDVAVCGDVAKEDVFRFAAEALTLTEAHGRSFSLCPSDETSEPLKQMRLCGYTRRDEVRALLTGDIAPSPAEPELSVEAAAEERELVLRSEAEIAAEREAELKELLSRARERGIANAAKRKYEEDEKAKHREEMRKYYTSGPTDEPQGEDDPMASLQEAIRKVEESSGDEKPPNDQPPKKKD